MSIRLKVARALRALRYRLRQDSQLLPRLHRVADWCVVALEHRLLRKEAKAMLREIGRAVDAQGDRHG